MESKNKSIKYPCFFLNIFFLMQWIYLIYFHLKKITNILKFRICGRICLLYLIYMFSYSKHIDFRQLLGYYGPGYVQSGILTLLKTHNGAEMLRPRRGQIYCVLRQWIKMKRPLNHTESAGRLPTHHSSARWNYGEHHHVVYCIGVGVGVAVVALVSFLSRNERNSHLAAWKFRFQRSYHI